MLNVYREQSYLCNVVFALKSQYKHGFASFELQKYEIQWRSNIIIYLSTINQAKRVANMEIFQQATVANQWCHFTVICYCHHLHHNNTQTCEQFCHNSYRASTYIFAKYSRSCKYFLVEKSDHRGRCSALALDCVHACAGWAWPSWGGAPAARKAECLSWARVSWAESSCVTTPATRVTALNPANVVFATSARDIATFAW